MTFLRTGGISYIFTVSDMFADIDEELFYLKATSHMMSYVIDGMTAGDAYYHYFHPITDLNESELQEIVYAEHLDENYAHHVIIDLRASVRNSIVSDKGVGE